MKKISLFAAIVLCVLNTQAQTPLDSIYNSAKTYNNTNIIANTQLRAFTLNTLFNKTLNGFKYLDTAKKYNDSSVLSSFHFTGAGTSASPIKIDSLHTKVSVPNIMATGTAGPLTFLRGNGEWAAPVSGVADSTDIFDSENYSNTDALSWYRAEIAKLKVGLKKTVHIAFIGDSNTDADGVFQKPLQEEARLSGFNIVPGWSCANPNIYPSYGVLRGLSAGWVNRNRVDAGKSVSLNSITSNSNSDYVQFETVTNGIAYDGVKIFYLRRSGGGTINYIEGGSTLHTQSTAGTAGTVGCWDIPSLSYSNRDFVLRPAGTDSVEILGVYMYSKTVPSIAISKFAHTGASSVDYAGIGSQFDAQVDSMGVDLAIINVGTNDQYYNFTAAAFKTNLESIADRLLLDSVKSVIIVAPSDNNTSPSSGKLAFVNNAKSVSFSKKTAFVNLYAYHGSWNSSSGLWIDDVHYNYTWAGKKNIDLIGGLVFGHDKSETQLVNNYSPVSSGAAGKLFFQSSTNKLTQNSNLHFDNSNVRLGLGTAAPDFDFHIRKTVNGSVIFGLINESAGANSRTIIRQGRSDAGGYYTDLGYAGENFVGTYPAASYAIENSANTIGGFIINNVANAPISLNTSNTERLTILGGGNIGIGTASPSALLDINSNKIRLRTAKTPSSATDTGNTGDICWDADYIYICVAANTWKRSAIATW